MKPENFDLIAALMKERAIHAVHLDIATKLHESLESDVKSNPSVRVEESVGGDNLYLNEETDKEITSMILLEYSTKMANLIEVIDKNLKPL